MRAEPPGAAHQGVALGHLLQVHAAAGAGGGQHDRAIWRGAAAVAG
jgi:hypothetical protein